MSCLFVDQLTVIDCAFLDVQRGLVGESYIVDVELEGELDAQSMVFDFSAVKKQLKRHIDAAIDHRLLVPMGAPELLQQLEGEAVRLLFRADVGAIEYRAPDFAVARIDAPEIDAEVVAAHLQPALAPLLPDNVETLRLHLRSEAIDGAYYHYTHGLRKHDGPCQRLAHGHRSRLQVDIDGLRAAAIEQHWALRWTDIHLASAADLVARANGRVALAYESREGRYELTLPESRVELFERDTTVECIAEHLATQIAAGHPGAVVSVRAYEGVNKGARATARSAPSDSQLSRPH